MTSVFLTCLKYLLEIIFDLFFYSLFQATHFGERPCSALNFLFLLIPKIFML